MRLSSGSPSHSMIARLVLIASIIIMSIGCGQKKESSPPPDSTTYQMSESASEVDSTGLIDDNRSSHDPTYQDSPLQNSALTVDAEGSKSSGFLPENHIADSGVAPAVSKSVSPMRSAVPINAQSAAADKILTAEKSDSTTGGFTTVPVFYGTDRAAVTETPETGVVNIQALTIGGAGLTMLCILLAAGLSSRKNYSSAIGAAMAALLFFTPVAKLLISPPVQLSKYNVKYSSDRGAFHRGLALVSIPHKHTRGRLEAPSIFKGDLIEDAREHVILYRCMALDEGLFFRRLTKTLAETTQPDMLVFVHGYNVGFDDAVRRTAQIASDLDFKGAAVCYSWPSRGTVLGYSIDENNVIWSTSHLKQFLTELVDRTNAREIHLVAHSMGNRALTEALKQMSYEAREKPVFGQVVLAAPDVDADHFRKDLALPISQMAQQVTLYASSNDRALLLSKAIHGYPRAGESGIGLVVVPGVDTIDVSGIDTSLLGHSYYGDNRLILDDLLSVVRDSLPASNRTWLQAGDLGGQKFWRLPVQVAAQQRAVR